jgi:ABC-type glycerol-3-phosphate transport system substrate-binding protein
VLFLIRALRTLIAVGCMAACSSASIPTPTPELSATAPVAVAQISETPATANVTPSPDAANLTLTPAPTPTPSQLVLRVWLPEPLAPVNNADAAEQLVTLISAFETLNPDIRIDLRLKASGETGGQEVGGVLSTLQTAAAVAPGALPDLTLLRRPDMLTAEQLGIIRPLENRVPEVIRDDLTAAAEQLGQFEGALIALPFMIDAKHIAYDPAASVPSSWDFDTVLQANFRMAFAAGRVNSLSDTFLAQYLSTGGALSSSGQVLLDTDALRTVLRFYEQGLAEGIFDPGVSQYTTIQDYLDELFSGSLNAGVVTTTDYLRLRRAGAELSYAPLPTLGGAPITVLDGWSWVLTTAELSRQNAALRFLNFLYDIDRHSEYAYTIGMIPSQRAALRDWVEHEDIDDGYIAFIETLIDRAVIQPNSFDLTARALQSAFVSVVAGQRSAADAVRDVLAQTGG